VQRKVGLTGDASTAGTGEGRAVLRPGIQGLELVVIDRTGPDFLTTTGVQKGLVALLRGEPLVQEGLGFGLPAVRAYPETLFSRTASLEERPGSVVKRYEFDRVARVQLGGRVVESDALSRGFEALVGLYMRVEPLQPPLLRLQEVLARALGGSVAYQDVPSRGTAEVEYALSGRTLRVRASFDVRVRPSLYRAKYVMANEQGADHFDAATVDGRTIVGDDIKGWLKADAAAFRSRRLGLSFSVARPPGAVMHLGRESNEYLHWSGINVESFSPAIGYEVELGARTDG
jgi:hypothetical protein